MTRPSRSPVKKKSAKNIKETALHVKRGTPMKKSTRRKSSSSAQKIALATELVENESPAPGPSTPSQDDVTAELDTVSWVVISNVHAKAAFEDIIEVLFQNFSTLRSHTFQCDSEGNFRGVIDVAFGRRDEAEEAVDLYHDNIKIFEKTWKLYLIGKRRCTRSSDAASSSSTKPVFSPLASIKAASRVVKTIGQSSSSTLSDVVRTLSLQDSSVEIGVSAKVLISNIAASVPNDLIEVLFEKAGSLKSLRVSIDRTRDTPGTAQVVYKRSEDAVAAVRHFANNITFFGYTWNIELDSKELSQPPDINTPSTSNSEKKGQSRLGR